MRPTIAPIATTSCLQPLSNARVARSPYSFHGPHRPCGNTPSPNPQRWRFPLDRTRLVVGGGFGCGGPPFNWGNLRNSKLLARDLFALPVPKEGFQLIGLTGITVAFFSMALVTLSNHKSRSRGQELQRVGPRSIVIQVRVSSMQARNRTRGPANA